MPPRSKAFAGDIKAIVDALQPCILSVDWPDYEESGKTRPVRLVRCRLWLGRLKKICPRLVFKTGDMEAALKQILASNNEGFKKPLKEQYEEQWLKVTARKVVLACQHYAKALRRKRIPKWVAKMGHPPDPLDEDPIDEDGDEGEGDAEDEGKQSSDAEEGDRQPDASSFAGSHSDDERAEQDERAARASADEKSSQPDTTKEQPGESKREMEGTHNFGFSEEQRSPWRAMFSRPHDKEFAHKIFIKDGSADTDYIMATWYESPIGPTMTKQIQDVTVNEWVEMKCSDWADHRGPLYSQEYKGDATKSVEIHRKNQDADDILQVFAFSTAESGRRTKKQISQLVIRHCCPPDDSGAAGEAPSKRSLVVGRQRALDILTDMAKDIANQSLAPEDANTYKTQQLAMQPWADKVPAVGSKRKRAPEKQAQASKKPKQETKEGTKQARKQETKGGCSTGEPGDDMQTAAMAASGLECAPPVSCLSAALQEIGATQLDTDSTEDELSSPRAVQA